MGLLGKKSPPAAEFRVPSLAECDETYASLVAKRAELHQKQAALSAERRKLEADIAADTSREIAPKLAELLGDEPGTKALNRKRLAEVRADIGDVEAALRIVEQRISDAHSAATRAACAVVRPEWARRVRAMVDAMRVLDEAHRNFDDLRLALEAEDIRHSHLGQTTPFFLGGAREPDRKIARYIKEVEAAGYGV